MLYNDFNPNKEIVRISATLDQPDKFSELFCKAASSQKNIDEVLRNIIRDLIQKDHSTIVAIKDVIKKYEKEEWWLIIKKGLSLGWLALLSIVSGAIGYWIK